MSLLFFLLFLALMILGVPIVFALILAPAISLMVEGKDVFLPFLIQRLYNGIDSFPLMAIPFFILAGEVMNAGKITEHLVNFSKALIGHFRGGLAQVNILSSILFAGMSGSAVADTSALGSMLIPAMEKNGYSRKFSAAVTAASSVIGPIIPPSGIMIIYAYIMNVSVGGLFAAGMIPGLMVGCGLMGITWYLSKKRNYPVAGRRATLKERAVATKDAFWPLLTPIILIGGILTGVFTPTEAAAVAAGYALLVSLFISRSLKFGDLPKVLREAAISSGVILLLVGAAMSFSSIVTLSGAAGYLTNLVLMVSDNRLVILFLFNILLFFVGMFLDAGPAILILGPVLGPVAAEMGVDPLHFAVIMCVNVTVGLATPPMGLILFVASSLSKESIEDITREILPFLAVEVIVIFLITFFPPLCLFIPHLLGFGT
ncbi:MAG: TRAP transporter large permease [Deltaproteobacteria bacterium]|jgi:TRAP-type transport system large permease protein|nr:TRAP transporter large permease [Deltaproteobacteria bacterium]MBT6502531.1 TRAP transporter large permease [Deltaproteobacteria bacterium]MBT7155172.1 TRAP transporter large permease [Deltaproteobacteria bacterium]MBT7715251.1 TRAP transporter large permease [Deltaproteobacteria bacterium]MBT7891391.1 TRAP transporter large permease [Deltaproteobacteria bacterium]